MRLRPDQIDEAVSVSPLQLQELLRAALSVDDDLLGLSDWPEELCLIHQPTTGRYACYCHEGVHCLACFDNDAQARRFAVESMGLQNAVVLRVSFDDAREIAKSRPHIVALILLDDILPPVIHFIC